MNDPRIDLILDPVVGYKIVELIEEYNSEDLSPPDDDQDMEFDDVHDDSVTEDALEHAEEPDVDPIQSELEGLLEAQNVDAQRDILALVWVGRGDYGAGDWSEARKQAREVAHLHVAKYLEDTPLAGEYLREGLSAMGYPSDDS